MGGGQGFGYEGNPFEGISSMLANMACGLRVLGYEGDSVALPTLSLGAAGEGARYEYGKIWAELSEEFRLGERESSRLADKARQTGAGYADADAAGAAMSAKLRLVFEAVHHAAKTPPVREGEYFAADDDPYTFGGHRDRPTTWKAIGGEVLTGVGVLGWGKAGFAEDSLRRYEGEQRALFAADKARNMESGLGFANRVEQGQLSRLAKSTELTRLNIAATRAFSWSAIAGGLAWSVVVVPSDEDIDRAVTGWNSIANQCAMLFGYDTGPVREAIAAAWSGAAMEAADARMVEFVAAGVHLAERTRRLTQALEQTVRDLDGVFLAALMFSGVSAAAIIRLGFAARLNPALRPYVEFLGSRLSTVAMLSANLVPVLAAAVIAWHRAADANRPAKIGDREVTGFRRS
ncbi:hypothetical protein [Nonomuraea roseoviolacea]|uniref:ESX-1 secretion-associated protein EspA/EspE-like domain-containing protein n=1 Tax=Nonomuraea roseoviolacea subsp. carminata TaxID=160689 RepID=A0ABT1KGN2_9ACTN|nr:hypothetical protein [Nonomuraea roseoviolacea]MCP2352812.1 hypothetical protein [Nonomuraea roseoviolacea subsp. carminata]